jgi:uncharacterized protein (DUF302 family)
MTASAATKVPFILVLTLLFVCACQHDVHDRIYEKTSDYDYDETLMNLDIAISEHNYRIIHRSNIGQAIRDRGEVNYPLSTVISFCNITYAKEMVEINSTLINDMPCIVTVRQEHGSVIVGTKLMVTNSSNQEENKFASKINSNLKSIVEATIK